MRPSLDAFDPYWMKALGMTALARTALVCCTLLGVAESLAVEATYTVRLETLWNGSTHPNNYPSSAHFSPLIGASHSTGVQFWAPGELATTGIERVAELGSTSSFRNEINAAISAGDALERIEVARNLFSGESGVSNEFTVNGDNPLVTLATMVAPSSDWFIGVHDFDLREGAGYLASHTIEFAHFYDAGTEEGSGFSLSNPPTFPNEVITLVTGNAAAAPFHGGGSASLAPIARLTFTRESLIGLPGDYNADGEVTQADYQAWREAYGAGDDSPADGNDDGQVDAADYVVWRDALAANQPLAVPEPGAVTACLLGSLLTLCKRRRAPR
ncbi:Spondin_N [Planctomycetes bacterium MalM25]|nr:Spondin_N [Planctomycetes bacterium MalM25]